MKVVVYIDRLVLDGFAQPLDLNRLRAALEAELSQALATPAPRRGSEAGAAAYRPAQLSPAHLGGGPETLGRGIARAALTRMAPAREAISRAAPPRTRRNPEAAS